MLLVEQPAAHAVARLDHRDRGARGLQVARGDQARQPRADDRHVRLAQGPLAHRPTVYRRPPAAPAAPPCPLTCPAMSSLPAARGRRSAASTSAHWCSPARRRPRRRSSPPSSGSPARPYAAAITPVIVALVSELLNRPAEKLAERFTLESDALPEAAGAGPPPRSEAVAPDPAPDQPPQLRRAGSPAVRSRAPSTLSAGDAAPVRVYRQPSPAGVRARRALPWRTILVTAGAGVRDRRGGAHGAGAHRRAVARQGRRRHVDPGQRPQPLQRQRRSRSPSLPSRSPASRSRASRTPRPSGRTRRSPLRRMSRRPPARAGARARRRAPPPRPPRRASRRAAAPT